MGKKAMKANERSNAYRAAKATSTEDGDGEPGTTATKTQLRPAEARSRRKINKNDESMKTIDKPSSHSDNFPSTVMQRSDRYKQAKQQPHAVKPGAVRVSNTETEEDSIASSKVPTRSERYRSQKKSQKEETTAGQTPYSEGNLSSEKIPYRSQLYQSQRRTPSGGTSRREVAAKAGNKNKSQRLKASPSLDSKAKDTLGRKQPGATLQRTIQGKGRGSSDGVPSGLSNDKKEPLPLPRDEHDQEVREEHDQEEHDRPRVGAQAIAGIDSGEHTSINAEQLHGLSGNEDIENHDDNADLVEAQLVKDPEFLEAEAVDVQRARRLAIAGAVCVIVIGLSIGMGLGLSIGGGGSGAVNVIINNISANDYYFEDFENYTRPASQCFESTQDLNDAVDAYASLKFEVEELLASSKPEKYLETRNESLKDRDKIASTFGWPIGQFCVSKVKNLNRVFSPLRGPVALANFNEDVSGWDVANVVNLEGAFLESAKFNQPLDLWNTSQVTSLAHTFSGSSAFNQNLSTWDVSYVETMESTFEGATQFDQPIGTWKTGRVSNMAKMFYLAASFNQDINGWDVQQVTSLWLMFASAETFNQDLSRWRLSSATEFTDMFLAAKSFNQPSLCEWELGRARFQISISTHLQIEDMIFGTSCPNEDEPMKLENWPKTAICGNCEVYFRTKMERWRNDTVVEASVPVPSSEALREAVDNYIGYRLDRHSSPEVSTTIRAQISEQYGWPIGAWNVSMITDFSRIFSRFRSSLVGVFDEDIGNWDVSNGRSFVSMFSGSALFNQDLSRWKVSKATDMSSMFGAPGVFSTSVGAASFNHDISAWNVSSVTNMTLMFYGAREFNQNLAMWDTSGVEAMESMFESTLAFSSNLPWNVTKVRTFKTMFRNSTFAGDVSQWDTSSGADFSEMFAVNKLFNGDISAWNVSAATTMWQMFFRSRFNHGGIAKWEPQNCLIFSHMFVAVKTWNISLCSWGPFLQKPGTLVTGMFSGTGCSQLSDPDLTAVPVSPLCVECG